jgi:tetrahydromethanopterin S-methyltransferase subunit E
VAGFSFVVGFAFVVGAFVADFSLVWDFIIRIICVLYRVVLAALHVIKKNTNNK